MRSRDQCDKSCWLIYWFFDFIDMSCSETLSSEYVDFFDFSNISRSETFPRENINFLILLIYLTRKPFRANISIFWFYRYISLGNLFERIYLFFNFTDISRSKTFPRKYINSLILLIHLAWKPFWANILIFLNLLIYLAWKPFRVSISNFRFYSYILLGNLFERVYQLFDFILLSCSETFRASICIFRVGP